MRKSAQLKAGKACDNGRQRQIPLDLHADWQYDGHAERHVNKHTQCAEFYEKIFDGMRPFNNLSLSRQIPTLHACDF